MKLELDQYLSLCRDIPEYNLKGGDVVNGAGDSIAVFRVLMSAVEKLPSDAVLAVCSLVGIYKIGQVSDRS